jgi:hypothetical protein
MGQILGDFLQYILLGCRRRLLTLGAVMELELDQAARWCQEHSMGFCSFPIPDRNVPESREAVMALIKELDLALGASK